MNEYPELKNFTAFNGLAIKFSPGVNVIIGGIGAGEVAPGFGGIRKIR